MIQDCVGFGHGGYILSVGQPYEGVPTPIAVPPTPTPIASEFGNLTHFTDSRTGFAISYPQHWQDTPSLSLYREIFASVTACLAHEEEGLLVVLIEDLTDFGLGGMTLNEYLEQIKSQQSGDVFALIKDEPLTTDSGLEGHILSYEIQGGIFLSLRALFVENDRAYNITYLLPGFYFAELEPLVIVHV